MTFAIETTKGEVEFLHTKSAAANPTNSIHNPIEFPIGQPWRKEQAHAPCSVFLRFRPIVRPPLKPVLIKRAWICPFTILDDLSRHEIAWKLCSTVKTSDLTETLALATHPPGCDQENVIHKPKPLAENGSSYISGELADRLEDDEMSQARGAPSI